MRFLDLRSCFLTSTIFTLSSISVSVNCGLNPGPPACWSSTPRVSSSLSSSHPFISLFLPFPFSFSLILSPCFPASLLVFLSLPLCFCALSALSPQQDTFPLPTINCVQSQFDHKLMKNFRQKNFDIKVKNRKDG